MERVKLELVEIRTLAQFETRKRNVEFAHWTFVFSRENSKKQSERKKR